jgi:hypothetical protein
MGKEGARRTTEYGIKENFFLTYKVKNNSLCFVCFVSKRYSRGWRMKRNAWLMALTALLVVALAAMTGCSQPVGSGNESDDDANDDSTPPTFSGLSSVSANGLTRATLTWEPATDDTTAPEDLVYEIWQASLDTIDTTTAPVLTTDAGETSAEVVVPGYREQFFLVQAVDEAGNRDGNSEVHNITTIHASWNSLDGGGEDGINATPVPEPYPTTESLGGELYVAWADDTAGTVRVSRYDGDGTSDVWTSVDDGGVSKANGVQPFPVSLQGYNGRLYLSWTESYDDGSSGSSDQVRVAVYDPAASTAGWNMVDGKDIGGLNRSATNRGVFATLAVVDGTLYAAWVEGFSSSTLYAAEYNGNDSSPSWSDAGGSLNYSSSDIPYDPDLAGYGGSPVVVWEEDNKIRAKIYDSASGSWSSFDGGAALNYDASSRASYPRLASVGDALYTVWLEEDSAFRSQVRVKVRDASGWRFVDGGGAAGLNYDPLGEGVLDPASPFVLNGTLYAAFAEKDSTDVARLRVVAYNGDDDNPAWQFVDGEASGGLNPGANYDAEFPVATGHEGSIIATWAELFGDIPNLYDVRVLKGQ